MQISVVIPVYNSQYILPKLVKNIHLELNKKLINFEIILINDYSKDKSWTVIKNLSKKYHFIRGINLKKNFGQHNALMAGFNECRGNFIFTMDDDLQHSPKDIIRIYNILLFNSDVCYVRYINRKHGYIKKFLSYSNHIISSFLLNKSQNIYSSSFRGLKKKIMKKLIKYKKNNVYIDALIFNSTRNISIIPVDHYPRMKGVSNYNFFKLFFLWCNMVENFPVKPIRFASIVGIILKFLLIFLIKKKTNEQFIIKNKTY